MHTSSTGPTSSLLSLFLNAQPVQRPAASSPLAALTGPSAAPPSADPVANAIGSPSVSASPPPGTDPKLWAMLTDDEQQFFSQMASLGPLTYGARPSQVPPEAPVGQRIDVWG